jgi:hypothetical protein
MPDKDVADSISIGATVKFRRRIGTCNRCGLCCEGGFVEWQMTQEDPANPKGKLMKNKCYYLSGNPGNIGATTCDIMEGDVDIDTIPLYHKEFYLRECEHYPDKEDPKVWGGAGGRPIGVDNLCAFILQILVQD